MAKPFSHSRRNNFSPHFHNNNNNNIFINVSMCLAHRANWGHLLQSNYDSSKKNLCTL